MMHIITTGIIMVVIDIIIVFVFLLSTEEMIAIRHPKTPFSTSVVVLLIVASRLKYLTIFTSSSSFIS
jgi:hypothetical protein